MKYKYFFFFFLLIAFETSAQKLPARKKIIKPLRLANEYFMNKWPDPGKEIITEKARPGNIWTRSVYYEGLMALYQIDPQKNIMIMPLTGAPNIIGDCVAVLPTGMPMTSVAGKLILTYT